MHLIQRSSGGATCIATLPWIALLSLSASIELGSSSARVTSVKSAKGLGVTQLERPGPIDRTPGIPGSDKNASDTRTLFFSSHNHAPEDRLARPVPRDICKNFWVGINTGSWHPELAPTSMSRHISRCQHWVPTPSVDTYQYV